MKDLFIFILGGIFTTVVSLIVKKFDETYDLGYNIIYYLEEVFNGENKIPLSLKHFLKRNIKDLESELTCFYDSVKQFLDYRKRDRNMNIKTQIKFNMLRTNLIRISEDGKYTYNNCVHLFNSYNQLMEAKDILFDISDDTSKAHRNMNNNYKIIINKVQGISNENSAKNYADIGDKKLRNDIIKQESFLNYWDKSDEYVLKIIDKETSKMRARKKRGLKIIDIGGGEGRVIKNIVEKSDEVFFIEPDSNRMNNAKNILSNSLASIYYKDCTFEDYEINPCEDELFDIVICSHVIQHICTNDYIRFINKISDILQPSGLCFLLCPVSYSPFDEYVVHGLEHDVWKIWKNSISCESELKTYLTKKGFEEPNELIDEYESNSNIRVFKKDQTVLYSIMSDNNFDILHKRLFDKGLLASYDRSVSFEAIKNELINQYNLSISTKFNRTTISRFWFDSRSNSVIINTNDGVFIRYPLLSVFTRHPYYNNMIDNMVVPLEFELILNDKHKRNQKYKLARNESFGENYWNIQSNSGKEVSILVRTQQKYILLDIDKAKEVNELVDFDKDSNNIDPEYIDGYLIEDNNELYFLRLDNDWYRFFKAETLTFTEFDNICRNEKYKDRPIICTTYRSDYLWSITRRRESSTIGRFIPDYIIMSSKCITSSSTEYYKYRDKRYSGLSMHAFDDLCMSEVLKYRILPSHHFVYNRLKHDININKLRIKSFYSYHLGYKKIWIDNFIFRDRWFNAFGFNYILALRKFFMSRDALFIIKKR